MGQVVGHSNHYMSAPSISIAPMMGRTDRHFRYFMRLLTKKALLYSEMIHAEAVIRHKKNNLIQLAPTENPVVLQVGGSDPDQLARCTTIAEEYGYDEINLNVGCPSPRVHKGNFGACLMADPHLVLRCLTSMKQASNIKVSIKHRIGIDGHESYEDLERFVDIVSASNCDRFVIHARIAKLTQLSAQQNRMIPPLRYNDVYRIVKKFPALNIEINGGITTFDAIKEHLKHTKGVMLGRIAYENPYLFSQLDQIFFQSEQPVISRITILKGMYRYLETLLTNNEIKFYNVIRHLHGLYKYTNMSKKFRALLTDSLSKDNKTILSNLQKFIHANKLLEQHNKPNLQLAR